jgi:hypothetical protein
MIPPTCFRRWVGTNTLPNLTAALVVTTTVSEDEDTVVLPDEEELLEVTERKPK